MFGVVAYPVGHILHESNEQNCQHRLQLGFVFFTRLKSCGM